MHEKIYAELERIIAARLPPSFSGRVLEVGASPLAGWALLASPTLTSAEERVGINLEGPLEFDGYTIVAGNANHMPQFQDESFDLVLCNAMLEHDRHFWMTVSEMHRVLAPGGVLVVGVPGYADPVTRTVKRLRGALTQVLGGYDADAKLDWLANSTLTYRIHPAPGDYYRFSPQAVAEVFLTGLDDVVVRPVMQPPRVIGSGVKPRQA